MAAPHLQTACATRAGAAHLGGHCWGPHGACVVCGGAAGSVVRAKAGTVSVLCGPTWQCAAVSAPQRKVRGCVCFPAVARAPPCSPGTKSVQPAPCQQLGKRVIQLRAAGLGYAGSRHGRRCLEQQQASPHEGACAGPQWAAAVVSSAAAAAGCACSLDGGAADTTAVGGCVSASRNCIQLLSQVRRFAVGAQLQTMR